MNATIKQFEKLGDSASYHYGDDTGGEWGFADRDKAAALKFFDDNPSMQQEMREISRGFLWSLKNERPEE